MRIRLGLALALLLGVVASAQAETWPDRPIHWIVPYPPGGGTDFMARALGAELQKSLGQPIIVDNKPGGSTVIGTNALVTAAPDGYTFGMVFDSLAINAALGVKTPYDPDKDIVPVMKLANVPLMLIVNSKLVPQKTLPDLVAYANAHPGWFTFGSLGPGSPHEIGFAWFKAMAKMDALIVPYRGINPALQNLLGGQIKGMFVGVAVADEYIKAGTLHAIAVTTKKRLASAPDIPTIAEQGYPDYDYTSFYGLAAPKGTPPAIVAKMNATLNEIMKKPEIRAKFVPTGAELEGGSAQEFGAMLKANEAKFKQIVAMTGMKPQ
jgi:tripartite-type tricarboxylate transporter receptor subunit TctC